MADTLVEVVKAGGAPGAGYSARYTTIQGAVNNADVTGGRYIIDVNDTSAFDEAVTITSVTGTPSITNYIWLRGGPGFRHSGVASAGTFASIEPDSAAGHAITVAVDFTRISHLEIDLITPGSSDECIRVSTNFPYFGSNILLHDLILHDDGGAIDTDGVYAGNWDAGPITLYNIVAYGFNRTAFHPQQYSTSPARTQTWRAYHCTAYDNGQTGEPESGAIYVFSNGSADVIDVDLYNSVGVKSFDSQSDFRSGVATNNTAPKGTVTWAGDGIVYQYDEPGDVNDSIFEGINNTTNTLQVASVTDVSQTSGDHAVFTNLTPGSVDLSPLDDAAGNALIGHGTAIATLPDSRMDLSLDIAGNPRPTSGPVDAGAFQFQAAGGGETHSGGSTATVTVDGTAGGVGAEAGAGGSSAVVVVDATGVGAGAEFAQGSSTAVVGVSASGAGVVLEQVQGGSTATIVVDSSGAGVVTEQVAGGATATVTVAAAGGGDAVEAVTSGSTAIIAVAASGGGAGTEAGGSGSTATITINATGGGFGPSALATNFDGAALSNGWTFVQNGAGNATHSVAGGFATLTNPAGQSADSIFSTSSPDNTCGLRNTVSGDFDIAVRIASVVGGQNSNLVGFILRGATDAEMIRWTMYGDTTRTLKYGYARSGGVGNNFQGPVNIGTGTSRSWLNSNPAWLRVKRVGTTFQFFLSGDGASWNLESTVTSNVVPQTIKLALGQYGLLLGQPLRFDEVVDLGARGTTDARDPVPSHSAGTTLTTDFSTLPSWLSTESGVDGSATVTGGKLVLSTAPANQSMGRVWLNQAGHAEAGMLVSVRMTTLSSLAFAVIGLEVQDGGPNIDQYTKRPWLGFELKMANTADNGLPVRAVRPLTKNVFDEPYVFLVPGQQVSSTALVWMRMEKVKESWRIRWWNDGASEPSTWQFHIEDDTIDAGPYAPYLSISHNDGSAVSATIEVDSLEFYELLPSGTQVEQGGSTATVAVISSGGGAAVEQAQGGSVATVVVDASGAGEPAEQAQSGSVGAITVDGTGAGLAGEEAQGGSTATIAVDASAAGSALEAVAGSSTAVVMVDATGGGSASEAQAGGSTASITVDATGAGTAQTPSATQGGSTATITVQATGGATMATGSGSVATVGVDTVGGGVATEAASGGSTASISVGATGGGTAGDSFAGGSAAGVDVLTLAGGAATELGGDGATASVAVVVTGGGQPSEVAADGSVAFVTVEATGGGQLFVPGMDEVALVLRLIPWKPIVVEPEQVRVVVRDEHVEQVVVETEQTVNEVI